MSQRRICTAVLIGCAIAASWACERGDLPIGQSTSGAFASGEIDTDPPIDVLIHPGGTSPGVASDGVVFLTAWRDWRELNGRIEEQVYAARVLPSGRVLDRPGLLLANGVASYLYQDPVSVAFDGTNFVVVWADVQIYAARVSPAGQILDSSPVDLSMLPPMFGGRWARVACGNTNCLVVWSGGLQRLSAVRIDANLTVLDSTPIVLAMSGSQPIADVAFDGVSFQAVWEDWTDFFDSRIAGVRVRPSDGVVLEGTPVTLSSTPTGSRHGAHIACEGQERCLVSWGSDSGVARVSQGVSLETRSTTIAGALTHDGTSYRSAWTSGPLNSESILSARLDDSGVVAGPVSTLVIGDAVARSPAIAATATTALVLWQWNEYLGLGFSIVGARVDAASQLLDAQPIPLTANANDQVAPAVAFDGTNYLWVWRDERPLPSFHFGGIYALRVSENGLPLDPPLRLGSLGLDPQVAFDGTNFIVVWRMNTGGFGTIVRGVRVSPAGLLLDPQPVEIYVGGSICSEITNQTHEAVSLACSSAECVALAGYDCLSVFPPMILRSHLEAIRIDPATFTVQTASIETNDQGLIAATIDFDGNRYLAVWSDGSNLLGARIAASGQVIDSSPISVVGSSTVPRIQPRLASVGPDEVLVFVHRRDVLYTRLSSAATSLDGNGLPVSVSALAQRSPTIASNGAELWVAWNDGRRDASQSEIWAAVIDPTGASTVSAAVVLASAPSGGLSPALALGTSGRGLLTYQRFDPAPAVRADRVHARLVSLAGDIPEPDAGLNQDTGSDGGSVFDATEDAAAPDLSPAEDASEDARPGDAGAAGDTSAGDDVGTTEDAGARDDAGGAGDDRSGPRADAKVNALDSEGCDCSTSPRRGAPGHAGLMALLIALLLPGTRRCRGGYFL